MNELARRLRLPQGASAVSSYVQGKLRFTVLMAATTLGLAACAGDGTAGSVVSNSSARTGTIVSAGSGRPTTSPPITSVAAEPAPTISGKSVTAVTAGAKYQFVPTASAPSGSTLTFNVQNKPEWASFDAASGAMIGTPANANVGTYSNIVISVSDGHQQAALPAFTVTVNQISNGAATLDWTAPTENVDGSALTDLAGYKVYYGTSASNLSESVTVKNAGLTSYTITNLSAGTWYFAIASLTAAGVESAPSGVITTTI